MNNYEFYHLLLNNKLLFGVTLFLFSLAYYNVYKNLCFSVFDPFFLSIVFSAISGSVVYLMFFGDKISLNILFSYTLTQLAFLVGLFAFPSIKSSLIRKVNYPDHSAYVESDGGIESSRLKVIFFYTSCFLYLGVQIIVYLIKGIPLFMNSRLETFVGGSGFGILSRFLDVLVIIALYSFFVVIRFNKIRASEFYRYVVMLFILITFFLSGSKSSFLIIFYVGWSYIAFSLLKFGRLSKLSGIYNSIKQRTNSIIIFCVAVVLAIIYLQTIDDSSNNNPFFLFLLRFVHSGDVYWYAYPNAVYLNIPGSSGFSALFVDFLGFSRIVNWDALPEAIGVTLKNIHHPSPILSGPNARHNVFGLIYFGFIGSILFSFVCGIFLSFVRNVLPKMIKSTFINGILFSYVVIRMSSIDADPTLAAGYLTNLIFVFPFVIFVLLIVSNTINSIFNYGH